MVVAASLSIVTSLALSVGIVRALVSTERPLHADVSIDVEALKASSGLESDFRLDLSREAGFITGPVVLEAALKRPEAVALDIVQRHRADPVAWLARRIRVEFPAPNILRIVYPGERTSEAASLANAVAAAYVDEMLDEAGRLRAERIVLLERGEGDVRRRLAEKRDAIGRLEKLLESCDRAGSERISADANCVGEWTRELATLRKAVLQGEEMKARATAELEKLKSHPHSAGVTLLRPAEL